MIVLIVRLFFTKTFTKKTIFNLLMRLLIVIVDIILNGVTHFSTHGTHTSLKV